MRDAIQPETAPPLADLPSAPTVSVIVATYDGERFLGEALESVLTQTQPALEVLVVDDGSRDASAALAAATPGVTVIRQANGGVARARNRGLEEARGDLVLFLDQDDRLTPHALAVQLERLRRDPACAFVFGRHLRIATNGEALDAPVTAPLGRSYYADHLRGSTLCPPSRALFRRDAVAAVGGFDPATAPADDYDLYLRLVRRYPAASHDAVVVEYRSHGGNVSKLHVATTLGATLAVLDAQAPFVRGARDLEVASREGRRHWQRLFGPHLPFEALGRAREGELQAAGSALWAGLRQHPQGVGRFALRSPALALAALARRLGRRDAPAG